MSADPRELIRYLKENDSRLYDALLSIIEQQQIDINNLNNLITRLTLPDVAYGHSHVPKLACLKRIADQSIVSGAATAIIFAANSVVLDNAFFWNVAFPTRLGFRVPGRYIVGGTLEWELSGAKSILQADIRLDGATIIDRHFILTDSEAINKCVRLYEIKRDSYIELVATQNSGAPLLALGAGKNWGNVIWAVLVERLRNKDLVTENLVEGDF